MRKNGDLLRKLTRDRRGATAIEYCMIIAMLALSILLTLNSINGNKGSLWGNLAQRVPAISA